ncbi:uncharacterized protein LOC124137725 [Haliotis rufescens]|uniref:uncharacterized protein LOC124137725 n=1 Tax=Haliotis rufescens TaxID=6454 RepID=UPI00201EF42C|nr:uncharacterized protein LOC124137725 [Haliotis rufescens]
MPRKNNISTNDLTEVDSLTFTNHVTYVKFGSQLELSRCENQSCGCSRVHCPFCSVHNYKPSRPARVRDHLNQTHFKHAVLYRGRNVVKCYMQCDAAPGHFHCPHCPKQLLKKAGFLYHLRTHLRKAGKAESLVQAPNFKHPQKVLFDGHVIQLCSNQCEGTLGRHYHCPLCEEKKFEEMGSLSGHLWRCREISGLTEKTSVNLPAKKNVDESWKANMAVNTNVPPPKERFGDKCHMSVVRNLSDLPFERCKDQGCCRNRFHCNLCPSSKFKPAFLSHIQEHYLSHWNSRAVCGAYSCLVCYQPCLPRYGSSVYHYHCPVCGQSRRRKIQFMNHLRECLGPSIKTGRFQAPFHKAMLALRQSSLCYKSTETDIHGGDEKEETEDPHQDFEGPGEADYGEGEDNSSLEKTVSHSVEEPAVTEDDGNEDVSMETSEQKTNNDQKKALEVFNTVLAILSPEFITSLVHDGPVDDLLRAVAMETGVEWLSSPGVNSSPVYSISGDLDSIFKAKQMLRQNLPESLLKSLQGTPTYSVNDTSANIPAISPSIPDTASHPSESEHRRHSQSDTPRNQGAPPVSIGAHSATSSELQYIQAEHSSGAPSSATGTLHATNPHHRSSRSTQADIKDLYSDFGDQVVVKQEIPRKELLINALEMLSSAVEIVKKKEESEMAQEEECQMASEEHGQTAQEEHGQTAQEEHGQTAQEEQGQTAQEEQGQMAQGKVQTMQEANSAGNQDVDVIETRRTRKRGHGDISSSETVTRTSKRKRSSSARENRGGMRRESPPPFAEAPHTSGSDKQISPESIREPTAETVRKSGGRPRGRPRGSKGKTIEKQDKVSAPVVKRYSTRGHKVDFSLLATGKKRKEEKPKPQIPSPGCSQTQTQKRKKKGIPEAQEIAVQEQEGSRTKGREREKDLHPSRMENETSHSVCSSETCSSVISSKFRMQEKEGGEREEEEEGRETIHEPRVEQETSSSVCSSDAMIQRKEGMEGREDCLQARLEHDTSPSVCSSESWTQTVEEMEVSDDEGESGDDDPDDQEATSSRASYKLVYSSMAVVPVVTFNMQSQSMSKQLIGSSVKKSCNTEAAAVREKGKDLKGFGCPVCEFQSDSFLSVVGHCSEKHGIDEGLHCDDCMVLCLDEETKSAHGESCQKGKQTDSESKLQRCPQCHYTSRDFVDVSDHIISEHDVERLRCDVCERVFSQHKAMDIHLSLKHGPRQRTSSQFEKPLTKCPLCSVDEGNFQALSSHLMSEHHVTNPLRCDVCERVFDSDSHLESHLNSHHGPFEEGLISNRCSECGLVCKSKTSLIQHQVYIHRKKFKKSRQSACLECKTCYFIAKTVEEIREHRLQHKLGVLECKECNMTFNSTSNLQFHMQLHHKKSHTASCDICGKVFKHKRYLIGHRKRHFGTKNFNCNECGKAFYEKCTLKAHEQIHLESSDREYRFVCPFCGNRYTSKSNFNDHLNKHTGEKPHKCTQCDKSFGFRSQLAQHKIFVHSTDRPFKCKECNKGFKLASKLQQHMIGHTGTSKHMCHRCNQAYCSSATLRIHQQKCRGAVVKKRPLASQVSLEPNVIAVSESEVHMAVMNSFVVMNNSSSDLDPQLDCSSQEQQTEIYLCSVCQIGFSRFEDAEHHINTEHEEMGEEEESVVMVEEESIQEDVMVDPTIQLTEINLAAADTMSETNTSHVVYQN